MLRRFSSLVRKDQMFIGICEKIALFGKHFDGMRDRRLGKAEMAGYIHTPYIRQFGGQYKNGFEIVFNRFRQDRVFFIDHHAISLNKLT